MSRTTHTTPAFPRELRGPRGGRHRAPHPVALAPLDEPAPPDPDPYAPSPATLSEMSGIFPTDTNAPEPDEGESDAVCPCGDIACSRPFGHPQELEAEAPMEKLAHSISQGEA